MGLGGLGQGEWDRVGVGCLGGGSGNSSWFGAVTRAHPEYKKESQMLLFRLADQTRFYPYIGWNMHAHI